MDAAQGGEGTYALQETQSGTMRAYDEASGMIRCGDCIDCRHGCNGSPCGSEACTFICHPGEQCEECAAAEDREAWYTAMEIIDGREQ